MGDEEEDVICYWMTLTKREDSGIWKRTRYIAFYGRLALEESMVLWHYVMNERTIAGDTGQEENGSSLINMKIAEM